MIPPIEVKKKVHGGYFTAVKPQTDLFGHANISGTDLRTTSTLIQAKPANSDAFGASPTFGSSGSSTVSGGSASFTYATFGGFSDLGRLPGFGSAVRESPVGFAFGNTAEGHTFAAAANHNSGGGFSSLSNNSGESKSREVGNSSKPGSVFGGSSSGVGVETLSSGSHFISWRKRK